MSKAKDPTESEVNFSLGTGNNSRVLREHLEKTSPLFLDLEAQIVEKRELFLKRHTYEYKERILYNNLPSTYAQSLNFDSANLYFFQNYFERYIDFDSVNYEHFHQMKMKYLEGNSKDSVTNPNQSEEKEDDFLKAQTQKLSEIQIDSFNDGIISLCDSFIQIIKVNVQNEKENDVQKTIVGNILDYIIGEFNQVYNAKGINHNNDIEEKLYESLCTFEDRYFTETKASKGKGTNTVIYLLFKFQHIALKFRSSLLFLKVLLICINNNISFNNFREIEKGYLKPYFKSKNLLKFSKVNNGKGVENKKDSSGSNSYKIKYSFPSEVLTHMFVADEFYVYLGYTTAVKTTWHLIKIGIHKTNFNLLFKESILELKNKHKVIGTQIDKMNQLIIVSVGTTADAYEKIIIDKEELSIISSNIYQLDTPSEESKKKESSNIILFFNSLDYFYISTDDGVYKISTLHDNTIPLYTKFRSNTSESSKQIPSETFFYILNDHVFFPKKAGCINYNIGKNRYKVTHDSNLESVNYDSSFNIFFDNYNNTLLISQVSKTSLTIQTNISHSKIKPMSKYLHYNDTLNESIEANKSKGTSFYGAKSNSNTMNAIYEKKFSPELYGLRDKYIEENVYSGTENMHYTLDSEDKSQYYFNFCFEYLVKYFIFFGNINGASFARLKIGKGSSNIFKDIFKKGYIINNLNCRFFDLVFTLLTKRDETVRLEEKYLGLLLESMCNTLLNVEPCFTGDIKICESRCPRLSQLFDFAFNNINNNTCTDACWGIISLINSKTDYIKKYLPSVQEKLKEDSIEKNEKIIYGIGLFNSNFESENELLFVNYFLKTEVNMICWIDINNNNKNHLYNNSKLNTLREKFLEKYLFKLLNWDCDGTNTSNIINKIFNTGITHVNLLLDRIIESNIQYNHKFLSESVTCKLFLLCLDLISSRYQNKKISMHFNSYSYITKLFNIIIKGDKCTTTSRAHDGVNEKSFIIETDHPCELEKTKILNIFHVNNKEGSAQFDCLSYAPEANKLRINGHCGSCTNGPTEPGFVTKQEHTNISYLTSNYDMAKLTKDNIPMTYGFKCKFTTIDREYENKSNDKQNSSKLGNDIQQSIIFAFGNMGRLKLEELHIKNKCKEKESVIFNSLFSSKLLENISLIPPENEIIENPNITLLKEGIRGGEDVGIKDSLESGIKTIGTLERKSKPESKNIITVVDSIRNCGNNEKYGTAISGGHADFIKKNPWGNGAERQMKQLVLCLFCIILKHEKLLLPFDVFVDVINEKGGKDCKINEIKHYKVFNKIYTELSKIKIWFNERKKDIAENSNTNNDEEIEKEISVYILKLLDKAEFILNALKTEPKLMYSTTLTSSVSTSEIKEKEYSENIQDKIDNLLIYIKTDEIEIQNLKDIITSQNNYALEKESSVFAMNILIHILMNNGQNVKDTVYFLDIILKGISPEIAGYHSNNTNNNLLVYFNHDVYGADIIYSHRGKLQIYSFIHIILNKLHSPKYSNSLKQNTFDTSYYLVLTQALFWPFKKRDYPFIKLSNFFNIFTSKTTISNVGISNDEVSKNNLETYSYGLTAVNYSSLIKHIFKLFSLYTFIVYDKFNENKNILLDDTPPNTELESSIKNIQGGNNKSLCFKRKLSEMDEKETFRLIDEITRIIFIVYDNYVKQMRLKIKDESIDVLSEEKLNSFLILFYRSGSFNTKLINYYFKNYQDILSTLIEINLYTSDKNKIISLKIIEMLILSNSSEGDLKSQEQFIITSSGDFKDNMKAFNMQLFGYVMDNLGVNAMKGVNDNIQFGISYGFTYAMLLQNKQNLLFYRSDSDMPYSINIVQFLQSVLVSNCVFLSLGIRRYLSEVIVPNLNKHRSSQVALLVLGANISSGRIGDKIVYSMAKKDKLEDDIDGMNIFSNSKYNLDAKNSSNIKTGIIIGFSKENKQIFNFEHINISNLNSSKIVNDNESALLYNNFYFSNERFAYVILEENFTKENLKTLSFDTLILETSNINVKKINIFETVKYKKVVGDKDNKILFKIIEQFNTLENNGKYLTGYIIKNVIQTIDDVNDISDIIKLNGFSKTLLEQSRVGSDIKGGLIPLEFLDNNFIELICRKDLDDTIKAGDESQGNANKNKTNAKDNISSISNENTAEPESEHTNMTIDKDSLYLTFNDNLIIEIPFLKVYNYPIFIKILNKTPNLPIHRYSLTQEVNIKKYPFILAIHSDLLTLETAKFISSQSKTIQYVGTNNDIGGNPDILKEITNIPIIYIDNNDYSKCVQFIFEQIPNEDYENGGMESLQKDFTSFIEIPIEMIDETSTHGSPRDLILKLGITSKNDSMKLNSTDNNLGVNLKNIEIVNDNSNTTNGITTVNAKDSQDIINGFIKGNAMMSRRIIIGLGTKNIMCTEITEHEVKNILKLLCFEMNIYQLSKKNGLYEIIDIIRNFICEICLLSKDNNSKGYQKIVSSCLDLSFLEKNNFIEDTLVPKIGSEFELLHFENIENNGKCIFSILSLITPETLGLEFYDLKMISCLILKVSVFKIKSNTTYKFIIDVLFSLFNTLNDKLDFLIISKDQPSVDYFIEGGYTYRYIFFTDEFIEGTKNANDYLVDNKSNGSELDAKILHLIILYIDGALKVKTISKVDLNFTLFYELKIGDFYVIYSGLNKKYDNISLFLFFCQKRGILPKYINQFSNNSSPNFENKKTIEFNYYDSNYTIPHVVQCKLNNKKYESGTVKIKSINSDIIGVDNVCFLFKDTECTGIQDYFRNNQNDKRVLIQNSDQNTFYISFPYTKFKNNLYGSGVNDKQSLGCGGETSKRYPLPTECLGLENAKNIVDFKFGYYHTFVQTNDSNGYTCGNDSGSSFKESGEFSSFNLKTHFQDRVQEEGIVGIWVNNYNASILLTKKDNNCYGCGNNSEYCGTDVIPRNETMSIPFLLPSIPIKIKEIACGFKSSLFILEDGSARTVGCNAYHQCGSLEDVPFYKRYFTGNPPGGGKFIHVVAGEEFFLLLVDEPILKGRGYSVGFNDCGRAGIGNDTSNKLQKCKGVECYEFVKISSRNDNSAAITSTGDGYTFGYNAEGALGLGTKTDVFKPTYVESGKDYICDDVGISHHHMLVITRHKKTGVKTVFSCGTNEYSSGALENRKTLVLTPQEINFFKEKKPEQVPMRVNVSRFQSYFLTMQNSMSKDISYKSGELKCKECSGKINNTTLYFTFRNGKDIEFGCDCCGGTETTNSGIYYSLTSPINDLVIIIEENKTKFQENTGKILLDKQYTNPVNIVGTNENVDITNIISCKNCGTVLMNGYMISLEEKDGTGCNHCFTNKCCLIVYPQVFYAIKNIKFNPNYTLPTIPNINRIIYPSIAKTPAPYLTLEITGNLSQYQEFLKYQSNEEFINLYLTSWSTISYPQGIELNKCKDYLENEQSDNKEYLINSIDPMYIYNLIQMNEQNSITDSSNIINTSTSKKIELPITKTLRGISKEQFELGYELSSTINDGIFDGINISNNFKDVVFIHKAVSENLDLISAKERLNIFNYKLEKLKVNVHSNDTVYDISRIKAAKFYEKNTPDLSGEFTVFGQGFQKMKKYPTSNYLCQMDNRLFIVKLLGEGSTDYGGPYRDVFSTICDELQSNYLNGFIKTPNHKNEIGTLRDKFIGNPSAKSAVNGSMFYFLGLLFAHAISSGNGLNLNIHHIFWDQLLGLKCNFEDYESIDKLFYKYIKEIEEFTGTERSFNEKYQDGNYCILLSDGSEYELIKNGKTKRVTGSDKNDFVTGAKTARINECKIQLDNMKYGLTSALPENGLTLLTKRELEELVCGKLIINIGLGKQFTEYQGFTDEDKTIVNFWKALESFTNDEKVLYGKYVWGRTRMPNPNTFKFTHNIIKSNSNSPDKRLPTATTCYFTLKLPNYSTYEILERQLRYVITNCSEIDSDFNVRNNELF